MMLNEKYRPRVHFSPQHGWMNDPNGLIVVDGTYHLFFQHDPDSVTHGSMHWGHAVSDDLVNWREQSLVLVPDHHGACWSGSAIETHNGEIKIFYTAHRLNDQGQDYQTQCIVHVDRGLRCFASDARNPILDNPGSVVFRDPKVIWHEESGQWIMLITLGQEIGFYGSADLRSWTLLSRFGKDDGFHGLGPWECPDMVRLEGPEGQDYWILIVGIGSGALGGGSGTQYFIGRFDGHRFRNENSADVILWLDFGRDCYAGQVFSTRSGHPPTLMAWASNWQYAKVTPTSCFRGVMTLPRRLELRRAVSGMRLAQSLPAHIRTAFPNISPSPDTPTPGTYRMQFQLMPGDGLSLFGATIPQLQRSSDGRHLRVYRDELWAQTVAPEFHSDYVIDIPAGPVAGEIYVDQGIVEISLFDGLVWITQLHYPDDLTGTTSVAAYRGSHP